MGCLNYICVMHARCEMARTPRNYDGTKTTGKLIGQVLPEMMRQIGERVQERPEDILNAWPEIIGKQLAPMTQALSYESGVLTVKVKSSTLYSQLSQYRKPALLRILKEKFPYAAIKNITFRIGGDCKILSKG